MFSTVESFIEDKAKGGRKHWTKSRVRIPPLAPKKEKRGGVEGI